MSIYEKLAAFAEGLPEERRREIEEIVTSLLESSDDVGFTAEELAELDRRMADPNPEYADPAEIEAIFRRYDKR